MVRISSRSGSEGFIYKTEMDVALRLVVYLCFTFLIVRPFANSKQSNIIIAGGFVVTSHTIVRYQYKNLVPLETHAFPRLRTGLEICLFVIVYAMCHFAQDRLQ